MTIPTSDDATAPNAALQPSSAEAVQSPRFTGVINADAALESGEARNNKYVLQWDEQ